MLARSLAQKIASFFIRTFAAVALAKSLAQKHRKTHTYAVCFREGTPLPKKELGFVPSERPMDAR